MQNTIFGTTLPSAGKLWGITDKHFLRKIKFKGRDLVELVELQMLLVYRWWYASNKLETEFWLTNTNSERETKVSIYGFNSRFIYKSHVDQEQHSRIVGTEYARIISSKNTRQNVIYKLWIRGKNTFLWGASQITMHRYQNRITDTNPCLWVMNTFMTVLSPQITHLIVLWKNRDKWTCCILLGVTSKLEPHLLTSRWSSFISIKWQKSFDFTFIELIRHPSFSTFHDIDRQFTASVLI